MSNHSIRFWANRPLMVACLGTLALTRMAGETDQMQLEHELMAASENPTLQVGAGNRLEFVRNGIVGAVFLSQSR